MPATRRSLDMTAYAVMLVCTLLWGLQQVTVKVAAAGVSPVMQGGIRSVLATALLLAWSRSRGIALFERDRTMAPGLVAGLLFAAEFFLIYYGLAHTLASRMVIFIYLAPVLTAIGLAWWVPSERLSALQWLGVALAFAGIVAAFADGYASGDRQTLLGDACGALAAVLWAATTVLIRATRLAGARAEKTLLYQLAVSALLLPLASFALSEPGVMSLDAVTVSMLLYQGVVVAFASYLAWFWLLTRYYAARLSVFAFIAPLAGVAFGVVLLNERLSASFVAAAVLVAVGIALVNARRG
ncbi:MAG TPA: DMT family transporter [Burkholderiaceae bacterium]|nr:DMT family transporter [Burkholderiaceae bacterium]